MEYPDEDVTSAAEQSREAGPAQKISFDTFIFAP
jgi:hypothetical protein